MCVHSSLWSKMSEIILKNDVELSRKRSLRRAVIIHYFTHYLRLLSALFDNVAELRKQVDVVMCC